MLHDLVALYIRRCGFQGASTRSLAQQLSIGNASELPYVLLLCFLSRFLGHSYGLAELVGLLRIVRFAFGMPICFVFGLIRALLLHVVLSQRHHQYLLLVL